MIELLNNAQSISRMIMDQLIIHGDVVVDATVGNGNDTYYLAEKVGERGRVYGFEIQKEGIARTVEGLLPHYTKRVELFHDSHENIARHIAEPVKVILYNLGYLPQSDHSITTLPETTILSLQRGLPLLVHGGAAILVVYRGHADGRKEWKALQDFGRALPQREFNMLALDLLNQANNPPGLIAIQKRLPKEQWD